MVKGVGYAAPGGNEPEHDPLKILDLSVRAEQALRKSVKNTIENPASVAKGLNASFTSQFGAFMSSNPMAGGVSDLAAEVSRVLSAELGKNITLTTPLGTGFVPFDLVAPSRLIYPVYSPLRNKIPRVPGQGTSRRIKVMTGVTGSQTGGAAGTPARISIPELVTGSGSLNNWPLNLPPSGSQAAVDLNIPYQFFGKTEALSWLSQFAGQGFEDISALANLVLLQEFMLGEEYTIISGSAAPISVPAAPTVTARTPGSNEVPVTGGSTSIYVVITQTNFFGETVASAAGTATVVSGDVYDVMFTPSPGALQTNIYVGTGSSAPANSGYYLMASGVGGSKYTLQGALPTGTANPPTADTGTASSTDYEGINSVLSGHAAKHFSGQYPSGFQGTYVNTAIGNTLNNTVVENALDAMWDGAGAFRADPAEIVAEGGDIRRLSDSIVTAGQFAYRLFIEQSEVSNIRAGAAVAEFQNPITRSVIRLLVHPWQPQGRAYLMSYTMPFSWSNVSNVLENVMVQDYISINWPTIDASWRYSMFMYGALVFNAPQYCGLLGGLQKSATTPYS